MRINKNLDYEKLVLLYFQYRNIYKIGFCKYSIFKNLIRYYTNINDYKRIRTIFQNLVNKGVFDTEKQLNGYCYRFNPQKIKDKKQEYFIINF